jgi:hypothetical protein
MTNLPYLLLGLFGAMFLILIVVALSGITILSSRPKELEDEIQMLWIRNYQVH